MADLEHNRRVCSGMQPTGTLHIGNRQDRSGQSSMAATRNPTAYRAWRTWLGQVLAGAAGCVVFTRRSRFGASDVDGRCHTASQAQEAACAARTPLLNASAGWHPPGGTVAGERLTIHNRPWTRPTVRSAAVGVRARSRSPGAQALDGRGCGVAARSQVRRVGRAELAIRTMATTMSAHPLCRVSMATLRRVLPQSRDAAAPQRVGGGPLERCESWRGLAQRAAAVAQEARAG
jgi:hypothetical protein